MMGWTPQTASACQSGGVVSHSKEASVVEVSTIGLDLSSRARIAHLEWARRSQNVTACRPARLR